MKDKAEQLVLSNLVSLKRDQTRQSERILYELSELSYLIAEEIKQGRISLKTSYDFVDGVRHLARNVSLPTDVLSDYIPFLQQENEYGEVVSAAAFSAFLSEKATVDFDPFPLKTASERLRLAYVRSPIAENAYERLSSESKDLSVLYVAGAEEACSAVSASHADYALLPLASANGERLTAIEKLTERHELYLSAAIPLGKDADDETLYGAFSSKLVPLGNLPLSYVEMRLTCESYSHICRVLSCFSVFGFTLVHLNIAPAEYGRVNARTILYGEGDLKALWFFLAFAARDFKMLGRYAYL